MEFKKVIAALLLVLPVVGFSQPASFYKVFSGTGYDRAEGLTQLSDSSYLITGMSSSFDAAPSQMFLLNIDKNGNYLWSNAYGGEESEEGKRVFSVPGFGHYIVGTSSSGTSHDFDTYIVFTDPLGNQQWEQWYNYGGWERAHNAAMFPDSSIVVVGETDSTANGNTDFYMFRVKYDGSVLWTKKWGSSGDDVIRGITPLTDSTYVICGTKYSEDSLSNKSYVGVYKLDGTALLDSTYGVIAHCELNDIHYYNSKLMAVGQAIKAGATNWQYHRMELTLTGNLLLEDNFDAGGDTRFSCFTQYTAANKLFVLRQVNDPNFPTFPEGEDDILSRYDMYFNWENYDRGYSNGGQDQVNQIIPTLDGFAAFVGFHSYYQGGGNTLFIVKIGDDHNYPDNTTSPVIFDLVSVIENKNTLEVSAFPNPFNEEVTIRLPENSNAELRILNGQGELVMQQSNTGSQLKINTSALASGYYFVEIKSELGNAVIKLVK